MKPNTFQERVGWMRHTIGEGEAKAWMSEVRAYALMAELSYLPDAPTGKKAADKKLVTRQAFRLGQRDLFEKWLADHQWVRVNNPTSGLPLPPDKDGLYFEVWKNTVKAPNELVVAFRGTEADDALDWLANLRWFIPFHLGEDQYDEARKLAGQAIMNELKVMEPDTVVTTTGHSLGGGLAQHLFYYSYRLLPGAQVTRCFAFDPSPVTGYNQGQAAKQARGAMMQKLAKEWKVPEPMVKQYHFGTARVYERGEILQYVRAVCRWFVPPTPYITELQCNFLRDGNSINQHSMSRLAAGIFTYPQSGGTQSKPAGK